MSDKMNDDDDGQIKKRKIPGYEIEYDSAGNPIHYKNSEGNEEWRDFDSKGNCIHWRANNGQEGWMTYNKAGELIYSHTISWKDPDNRQEYKNWYEYDSCGRTIHIISEYAGNRNETWYEYDENGTCVHEINYESSGKRWSERWHRQSCEQDAVEKRIRLETINANEKIVMCDLPPHIDTDVQNMMRCEVRKVKDTYWCSCPAHKEWTAAIPVHFMGEKFHCFACHGRGNMQELCKALKAIDDITK